MRSAIAHVKPWGRWLVLALSLTLIETAWCGQPPSNAQTDALASAYKLYDAGDFGGALRAFGALADRGSAEAQYMVGLMHHRGRGTPVNGVEAARWYARAAEHNLPPALANLGIVYRDGLGDGPGRVEPDRARALEYLRRAAYLENVPGQLAYAAMLINQTASRDERIEGVAFMRIAADAGDETAQDNLEDIEIEDDVSAAADLKRREIEATIRRIKAIAKGEAQPPATRSGSTTLTRPDNPAEAAPTQATPVRAPGDAPAVVPVLRLRKVVIRDPMVNNCEAVVMLAPAEWRFDGRIDWFVNESVLANPVWVMSDPATGASIRSLPFRQFTWSGDGLVPIGQNHLGMTVLPPITDPAEFVQRYWVDLTGALPHLRGLAPVSAERMEALGRLAVREWGAPAEAAGFRLRYRFDEGGQELEEEIRFALLYAQMQPTTWLVTHCTAVRAPRGRLDAVLPVAGAVCCSGSYTSEWRAAWRVCFDLLVKNARGVIRDSRALAETIAANREHQQQLQREIERDRDASLTARNAAFREALGGVETYSDPYQGRSVEMPQGYQEAWVNERGEYLLSERPGFDPNVGQVADAKDWKRMQRVDPMEGRR